MYELNKTKKARAFINTCKKAPFHRRIQAKIRLTGICLRTFLKNLSIKMVFFCG